MTGFPVFMSVESLGFVFRCVYTKFVQNISVGARLRICVFNSAELQQPKERLFIITLLRL